MRIQNNPLYESALIGVLLLGVQWMLQMMLPNQWWIGFILVMMALFGLWYIRTNREQRSMSEIAIIPFLWILGGLAILIVGVLTVSHGLNLAWPPIKAGTTNSQPQATPTVPPTVPPPSTQHQEGPIGIKLGEGGSVTAKGNYFEGMCTAIDAGKNSTVDASKNVIKKGGQGYEFPPPMGEFTHLSSAELRDLTHAFASEMRIYETAYDQKKQNLFNNPDRPQFTQEMNELSMEKSADFQTKFAKKALSLASELLSRTGRIESQSTDPETIRMGAIEVQRGMLMGPHPINAVADFLEYLAGKLQE
jgi:hypothetical protein